MEKEKLIKEDFADRADDHRNDSWTVFNSFTLSSIRWLQHYSHCYSISCSFICLPLWIFVLPIALSLDLCIYLIVSITFAIIFLLTILCAPLLFLYQRSDVCSPMNMYRFSLRNAWSWSEMTLMDFQSFWWSYCGTGDIESGAPIWCTYCCCAPCQSVCHRAARVKINDTFCTIL